MNDNSKRQTTQQLAFKLWTDDLTRRADKWCAAHPEQQAKPRLLLAEATPK